MYIDNVTIKDIAKIKANKKTLLHCPICGSKAYMGKDIVDGFYFGWSVCCPRFSIYDNIHGIDGNAPQKDRLSIHNLDSEEECIEKWNEKVNRVKTELKPS